MNYRREEGVITVYLTIIFLIVLALAGALVDGARVRVGETQISRTVDSAAISTLAAYHSPLKQDYGLFALNKTDPEELERELEKYIKTNLIVELGKDEDPNNKKLYDSIKEIIGGKKGEVEFVNLFDYRVENISVDQLYSLTENPVIRNQIVEFMKFRGPAELYGMLANQDNVIEKIEAIQKIGKTAELLNMKIELNELSGKFGSLQNELAGKVEFINLFPEDFHGDKSEYNDLKKYSFEELKERYEESAIKYIEELESEEVKSSTEKRKEEDFKLLIRNLEENKRLNNDVVETISKINNMRPELEAKISKCKKHIAEQGDSVEKTFKNTFIEDIEKIEKVLKKEGEQSIIIKRYAEENQIYLQNKIAELNRLNNYINNYDIEDFVEELNHISRIDRDYHNNIVYELETVEKKDVDLSKDTRNKVNQDLKKLKEEDSRDDSNYKEIDRNTWKKLPSYEENGQYPNKSITDTTLFEIPEDVPSFDIVSEYSVGESGKYNEKDMDFTKELLNQASKIGELIGENILILRDELYVNEYIMGMFINVVPQLKSANLGSDTLEIRVDTTKDLTNRKKGKDGRFAYFEQGEVEYILFGKQKEKSNIVSMKSSILALRMTSNLISIHTMSEKVEAAEALASTIAASAAIFSGGSSLALQPIIREAILAGWAMAESIADLNYIMEGRSIPIYKNNSTWITDFDGQEALKKGEKELLALSYHDYLRLGLLIKSKDGKMDKLEDLIQLNLIKKGNENFMLKNYYTNIKVDGEISMRYLFMTSNFMPKSLKTKDGKHKLKAVIYQGY